MQTPDWASPPPGSAGGSATKGGGSVRKRRSSSSSSSSSSPGAGGGQRVTSGLLAKADGPRRAIEALRSWLPHLRTHKTSATAAALAAERLVEGVRALNLRMDGKECAARGLRLGGGGGSDSGGGGAPGGWAAEWREALQAEGLVAVLAEAASSQDGSPASSKDGQRPLEGRLLEPDQPPFPFALDGLLEASLDALTLLAGDSAPCERMAAAACRHAQRTGANAELGAHTVVEAALAAARDSGEGAPPVPAASSSSSSSAC